VDNRSNARASVMGRGRRVDPPVTHRPDLLLASLPPPCLTTPHPLASSADAPSVGEIPPHGRAVLFLSRKRAGVAELFSCAAVPARA
jgi:hypothetical protein